MRRIIFLVATFAATTITIFAVTAAYAHPADEFTVNRYAGLLVQPDAIYLDYVVDTAEIPAYEVISQVIGQKIDGGTGNPRVDAYRANKCAEYPNNISLMVNDSSLALTVISSTLEFPPGAGGLRTLRLTCDYRAGLENSAPPSTVVFRDLNFTDRLGWREIVVHGEGVGIYDSTVGSTTISDRLKSYPAEVLANRPNQTEVRFKFDLMTNANSVPNPKPRITNVVDRTQDPFAALIAANDMSLPAILLSLALALGLGAAHAVSPGHGKTIMAAYLVGTRGNSTQAVLLGMTVTITHTLGVLILGVITLFASRYILPESLYPWLSLISGILVIGMGVALVIDRLRLLRHNQLHDRDGHHHHHGFVAHEHSHMPAEARLSWTSLVGLGMAGGLVPSASALILLLSAISLQRIPFGIVLIIAFGVGMAVVLVGIGILFVRASSLLERRGASSRIMRLLPVISAIVVVGAGIVVTTEALLQMGIYRP